MVANKEKPVLRNYQKIGVKFLLSNEKAFLADDMGLGKTIQVITAFSELIGNKKIKDVLIVVPNGLIPNWINELAKWSTIKGLTVVTGSKSNREAKYFLPTAIKIVSYDSLSIDWKFILNRNLKFDLLVLDEAQRIKNSRTKAYLACSIVKAKKKWLMTGTPIENRIEELLNLLRFIDPSFLNTNCIDSLEALVENLDGKILRRTRGQVLKELPEKIDQDIYLNMNQVQQEDYESYLKEYRRMSKEDVRKNIFSYITQLKQLCNFSKDGYVSSKLDYIKTLISEEGHKRPKIIIFSQYVKSLLKIENILSQENIVDNIYMYHGGMSSQEKETSIDKFQNANSPSIILMSLKAGAVGLNLQSATHVVLFDRWWNPALEEQAIARAHRMGRKEPLFVARLIISSSIEEKINEILIDKKEIIDFVDKKAEGFSLKTTEKLINFILD